MLNDAKYLLDEAMSKLATGKTEDKFLLNEERPS